MNIDFVPNDKRDAEINLTGRKAALNELLESFLEHNVITMNQVVSLIQTDIDDINTLLNGDEDE